MQITVRSSRVAKTGTNEKGTWELIVVVDETTGIEYTTFDKKAHTGAGAVLEIGEAVIKEGKHSFKKVVEIIKGAAAPAPPANGERAGMTPELWAEKDRLDRHSKECNTCFMGIMELAKTTTPEGKFSEVYDAALDWALAHFKHPPQEEKPATKPAAAEKAAEELPKPDNLVFANKGEFYTACLKYYALPKSKVDAEIVGYDLDTEKGRAEAWAQVMGVYADKPF